MKNMLKSILKAACVAAVLATTPVTIGSFDLSAVSAQAKKKKPPKNRKVPSMTQATYRLIEKATESIELKEFDNALEQLHAIIDRRRTNDYERASAWQNIAQVYFETDNMPKAIEAMEGVIALRMSIREPREHSILFSLAQLHFTQESYKKSLDYVAQWEKLGKYLLAEPTIMQRVFIAQVHYTLEDFPTALSYLYAAINEANTNPEVDVKENWYLMAASGHYELGQLDKYRDVMEILVVNFGKPSYLMRLAGIYSEMGKDETFYSLSEAAYKMGYLDDKPNQIVNTAQIMLARQAPIKSAWILEKALSEDRIEHNASNQKLLGQSYMLASEYEKSVKPLRASAAQSKDGQLWFQVGQVELQNANYRGAVTALDKALSTLSKKEKRDKSSRMTANLLKANALAELKRYSEAKKALRIVQKDGSKANKRQARAWLRYVDSEIAREKMLKGT